METDRDSEEVVVTENKEDCSESWIQAINSTEQMIESISPPLLSLVTSDAELTIEETEAPTNGKARELSLRMSGRASRQEDEVAQQKQE
uniref:PH domain-containing protein n=1 Tax=Trichogramma kaykai TaxID=54128 RepID=A0ABD2W1S3_9HYME